MKSTTHDDLRLVELHFSSLREMRTVLMSRISSEGLFLEGEVDFEVSELLRIRAVLPEDFVLFEAVGVVLWVDRLQVPSGDGPMGTAVRWVTLDEKGRTVVEDLVSGQERSAGEHFVLTPHEPLPDDLPTDAFSAQADEQASVRNQQPNPTKFKFTVRGAGEPALPSDESFDQPTGQESSESRDEWTSVPDPGVAEPQGFDPDRPANESPGIAIPFDDSASIQGQDLELEWVESDAAPAGRNDSLLGQPAAFDGGFASGAEEPAAAFDGDFASGAEEPAAAEEEGPLIPSADFEGSHHLEEMARRLDQENAIGPSGAMPPASTSPPEEWTSPLGVTQTDPEPLAVPAASPTAEPVDVTGVFDDISEADESAPAAAPVAGRSRRGGRLGLLLALLLVVLVVAGGWYWWDQNDGSTGIETVDAWLGLSSSSGDSGTVPLDPDPAPVEAEMDSEPSETAPTGEANAGAGTDPVVGDEPTAVPTVAPTPRPEPTPAPARQDVRARAVAEVAAAPDGGGLDLLIRPERGVLSPDRFLLEDLVDPRRALIRVIGIEENYYPYTIETSAGGVLGVRIGFHPEQRPSELWVVVDLTEDSPLRVRGVQAEGDHVRVRLRP